MMNVRPNYGFVCAAPGGEERRGTEEGSERDSFPPEGVSHALQSAAPFPVRGWVKCARSSAFVRGRTLHP